MEATTAFATRLKALREEKGLSQDELGKQIGISRGSISFYEKESRTPDIVVLDSISKFFDVSLDYLMGNVDSKTSKGAEIEKNIGLSEKSVDILEKYNKSYTPDDMKTLNDIIQNQDIMRICVCLNAYNASKKNADKLQILILNYIKIETFFHEHNIEYLKEYLQKHDITLEIDKLNSIDEFVNYYIDLSQKCDEYTSGSITITPPEETNSNLLEEAEHIFSNMIDQLVEERNI